MFGTLLGGLPRPPLPDDADPASLVDAVLAAQVEAGLEPVTDGGWWGDAARRSRPGSTRPAARTGSSSRS